jgi:phosphoketolase
MKNEGVCKKVAFFLNISRDKLHMIGNIYAWSCIDNPDLLAVCVVGDGETETGPLGTSWHSNKFLNPTRDGTVPIPHLEGPTTMPFDMVVLNDLDRFHLVMDVIDRVCGCAPKPANA